MCGSGWYYETITMAGEEVDVAETVSGLVS